MSHTCQLTALPDSKALKCGVCGEIVHPPVEPVPYTSERAMLTELASDPAAVHHQALSGKLSPGMLSRVLEALGTLDPCPYIATLIQGLDYPQLVVQEGAIIGLASHLEDDRVPKALAKKYNDPTTHLAIKAIIKETVE